MLPYDFVRRTAFRGRPAEPELLSALQLHLGEVEFDDAYRRGFVEDDAQCLLAGHRGRRLCAATFLVFLAAATRTWFVSACLCLLDLERARRWLQIGLGRIHRAIPVVLSKAGPP